MFSNIILKTIFFFHRSQNLAQSMELEHANNLEAAHSVSDTKTLRSVLTPSAFSNRSKHSQSHFNSWQTGSDFYSPSLFNAKTLSKPQSAFRQPIATESICHSANSLDPYAIIAKLEKENENAKRVINILDERAGPAIVEARSSSSSDDVPPVFHQVQQRDPFFAKEYTYTTNVSCEFSTTLSNLQ